MFKQALLLFVFFTSSARAQTAHGGSDNVDVLQASMKEGAASEEPKVAASVLRVPPRVCELNVGSVVVVVDTGKVYTTFQTKASELGLANWTSGSKPLEGTVGTVAAQDGIYIGFKADSEHEYVIHRDGLDCQVDRLGLLETAEDMAPRGYGKMTRDMLHNQLERQRAAMSEIRELFLAVDDDHSGTVSWHEFQSHRQTLLNAGPESRDPNVAARVSTPGILKAPLAQVMSFKDFVAAQTGDVDPMTVLQQYEEHKASVKGRPPVATIASKPSALQATQASPTGGYMERMRRSLGAYLVKLGSELSGQEREVETQPGPKKSAEAVKDCSAYMKDTGCDWTLRYNCQGQSVGSEGTADDDGSQGYDCCCNLGLWEVTQTRDENQADEQGTCLADDRQCESHDYKKAENKNCTAVSWGHTGDGCKNICNSKHGRQCCVELC